MDTQIERLPDETINISKKSNHETTRYQAKFVFFLIISFLAHLYLELIEEDLTYAYNHQLYVVSSLCYSLEL